MRRAYHGEGRRELGAARDKAASGPISPQTSSAAPREAAPAAQRIAADRSPSSQPRSGGSRPQRSASATGPVAPSRATRSRSPAVGAARKPLATPTTVTTSTATNTATVGTHGYTAVTTTSKGVAKSRAAVPPQRTPRTAASTPSSSAAAAGPGTGASLRPVTTPRFTPSATAGAPAARTASGSPARRASAVRTTSHTRRRLRTSSLGTSKPVGSRKSSGTGDSPRPNLSSSSSPVPGTAAAHEVESAGPSAAPPASPAPAATTGVPSIKVAPTHLQQLQASPKKPSLDGRGLKANRGLRRETTSPGGATSSSGSHATNVGATLGGCTTAVASSSSSSRAMVPIVHIRMRPLLSYLNESNEQRKVWFLDHENLVVRAATGTAASSGLTLSANGLASGGAGGGGVGGGNRVLDRRPTLTPPPKQSRLGNGHSSAQAGGATVNTGPPAPPHQSPPSLPCLQAPVPPPSSTSLDSSFAFLHETRHVGSGDGHPTTPPALFDTAPLGVVAMGRAAEAAAAQMGHSRSLSEQSLISEQLESDRTSAGHLSTSSPPPLHLVQPSATPSVSGTSTPRPLPKLGTFLAMSTRGIRSGGGPHSQQTSPGLELLATTAGSGLLPPKSFGSPARLVRGSPMATRAKRPDGRTKDGGRSATPGTSTTNPFSFTPGGGESGETGMGSEQHFNFEFIHDEGATQEEVFEDSVLRFADEALLAQNVTILCYGPTGSGKTFSMMGNTSSAASGGGHGAAGGATGGGGTSRRASVTAGLHHGRTSSYGVATALPSPSKSASRHPLPLASTGPAGSTESGVLGGADGAKGVSVEYLEDSIAQVSDEDTDDDEWPLFDHTWYRDRQRRAMLMDAVNVPSSYDGGRVAAVDNMRTTEMGILPRLVRVLLDRRNESVVLSTVEAAGGGAPGASSAAGSAKRGGGVGQPPSQPPLVKKRKSQEHPTRRTVSLTLRDLTFYGIEIYCDELSDLMDPGKRPITNVSDTGGLAATCGRLDQSREDAVRAATASASAGNRASAVARANTGGGLPIESLEDLRKAYRLARRNRVTAPHARNERSSRSHAVFVLQLRFELLSETVDTSTGEVVESGAQPVDSYVAMVDLAGSERLKESQVESGQALREAQYINKSLSALSSVVLALYQRSSHVPFRDSKLTRMLRPCLEGGRVLILVHVAPCSGANTLNTLKFADQVRHTMVQTHRFGTDVNKRGLLDIFADLVDPEQAKMETAYAHTLEKYEQMCAEVRLALLTRSLLADSTTAAAGQSLTSDGSTAHHIHNANNSSNVNAAIALLDTSATLTMSRVSSPYDSIDGVGEEEAGESLDHAPVQLRQRSQSPPVPQEDSGVGRSTSPLLPSPDTSTASVRAFKLSTLVNHYFAPLKASEDAGVQEAIRDIALERDRRVEAAKRRTEMEVLNLKAAIDEMARYNAQLARENASPLPSDPYRQELSRQVRATAEEVKEHQSHNMALQACVNVLRQRVAAQEDIEQGVDADVEEMRSKGLLPAAPAGMSTPPPPTAPTNTQDDLTEASYLSYTTQDGSSVPRSPLPLTATPAPSQSTLTYVDTEVVTDAEMREIGYQQVLLSQELSALRIEAACYAMGDGIWEGLWARAVRQELLTALRVEVALMENVLLDRDVLKSLASSAEAVVAAAATGACAESKLHTRSPAEDCLTVAPAVSNSTPPSPAARRKRSPSSGRRGVSGKASTHPTSEGDSGSAAPSASQRAAVALTTVEAYLSQLERKDGAPTARVGGGGEDSRGRREGPPLLPDSRASGEQADRDVADPGRTKGGALMSSGGAVGGVSSTAFVGGPGLSSSGTASVNAVTAATPPTTTTISIPNPLEAAFPTARPAAANHAVAAGNTPPPSAATSRSASVGATATTNSTAAVAGASEHHGSRRSSLLDSVAAAYTPLSLVGSYGDEERLQRTSVLKMLTDGVPCEAVCIGDGFAAVVDTFLAPPSSSSPLTDHHREHMHHTGSHTAAAANGENANDTHSEDDSEAAGALEGDEGGGDEGEHVHPDGERERERATQASPDYALGSRRDSVASTHTVKAAGQALGGGGGAAAGSALPMTKHFGRLRLVRKLPRGGGGAGGGGSARRSHPAPDATLGLLASTPTGTWIRAEDGAVYCLEFVYSHHGVPLPPRLADAIQAAVKLSHKAQLEEMVDSLPSPMDMRRGYTPATGNNKALSQSAAALLKERRLFSIPLSEPQLAVDLHLMEAGTAGGTALPSGGGGGGRSPPPTARTTPSLVDAETPRPRKGSEEDCPQIALELHGIPLSSSSTLLHAPPGRVNGYQQFVKGPGAGDTAEDGHTSASSALPVGKDVVMAKRMREGGELLLPSPCILPNKGTCTLLLRFPGQAMAGSTRLESVEAIVAALCGVMPPAVSPAAAMPIATATTTPTRRGARRSPPADVTPPPTARGEEDGRSPGGGGGAVVCVHPHVPHVLVSPNPMSAGSGRGDATVMRRTARGDGPLISPSCASSGGGVQPSQRGGVEKSPDPHRPLGTGKKILSAPTRSGENGGGKSRSKTSAGSGANGTGGHAESVSDAAALRGAALRVHLHFPGSPYDNVVDAAAIGSPEHRGESAGKLSPIQQSILHAATMLQGFRVLTIGPFTGSGGGSCSEPDPLGVHAQHRSGENIERHDANLPRPPTPPPVLSARAATDQGDWRVAQRLFQLHTFNRSIRSLIKQQIFEAEDIKADTLPSVVGTRVGGSAGVGGGRCVREVTAEAQEAVGLLFGARNDGTLNTSSFSAGSPRFSPRRGPHAALTASPSALHGDAGAGTNAVRAEVSVAQARELGGPALPWTLWQWAYRWPAIAEVCGRLERAALLATAGATAATSTTNTTTTTAAEGLARLLQRPQYLQSVLGLMGSPRATGLIPVSAFASASFSLGSPVGGPANRSFLAAGSGEDVGGDPASPWSTAPEGGSSLEPVVLGSDSDEDDTFNSFGHGNWIAESAAAVVGGGTGLKTIWLPELVFIPVPDFLSSIIPADPPGDPPAR